MEDAYMPRAVESLLWGDVSPNARYIAPIARGYTDYGLGETLR